MAEKAPKTAPASLLLSVSFSRAGRTAEKAVRTNRYINSCPALNWRADLFGYLFPIKAQGMGQHICCPPQDKRLILPYGSVALRRTRRRTASASDLPRPPSVLPDTPFAPACPLFPTAFPTAGQKFLCSAFLCPFFCPALMPPHPPQDRRSAGADRPGALAGICSRGTDR